MPTPDSAEFESLLHRCRTGDDAAFAELYETHRRPVLFHLRRLCGDRILRKEDTEDLAQSVFVALTKALRRGVSIEDPDGLRAYVQEITRNVVRGRADRWAARRRDPAREQAITDSWELRVGLVDAVAATPASQAAAREQLSALEAAVQRLPDELRTLIELRRSGLDTPEIVARTGIPERTVRRRIAQGAAILAGQLETVA